jgi:Asp-tRNA(Asn)/Glu-tRNA(Gln) amidotransferase A subunit family amidase
MPVGMNKDGLLIGLQFVGEWWAEGRLLEMAK